MAALRGTLDEAVRVYNSYRSPMATATLVATSTDQFRVQFTGPFCTTCCRDDYFEDLIYELIELGIDRSQLTIDAVHHKALETFVVDYSIG